MVKVPFSCRGVFRAVSVSALFATSAASAAQYDVAAYVWPAYQPEKRWAELGIFAEGIGEWQNVKEAVPKWKGHLQPLRPLWGYENEADPEVVAKKIDTAVAHGINVFIYDWYWYGGRPFLEDALNEGFLKAPNNGKMRFFIMWANHHVNWLWDNKAADKKWSAPRWRAWVSRDEFRKLAKRWIEMYFRRGNYYRIEGKPVLMIYEVKTFIQGVGGLAQAAESLDYLRSECKAAGLGGVHVMACDFGVKREWVKALGIESATIYNFVHWASPSGNPDYSAWCARGAKRFDKAREELGLKGYFAHASVGWDTNPRYPPKAVEPTVLHSSPFKFEAALRRAKDWCDRNTPPGWPRLISVNSWNEWTEGSYLEPDEHFGYGYLEAVRKVFGPSPSGLSAVVPAVMGAVAREDGALPIDAGALADLMPLAMEAAAIHNRAGERERRHKESLRKRGIAELPPSPGEKYVIDPGGLLSSLGLGSLFLDEVGCLYIDRRFVTEEEMATVYAIEKWLRRHLSPDVARRIEQARARPPSSLPVFRGFENARYQKHDALIARLTAEFNASKAAACGGTASQAAAIADLSPALVKSHMIEESGGNDPRSLAAWEVDPLQVNVPGDWGDEKKLVGLEKPARRNEGDLETNVRAAIRYLSRKGFSTSAKPAEGIRSGRFGGWQAALRRYNGRRDRTDTNRYYSEEYADKILKRAADPGLFVPIEIKLAR